MTFLHKIHALPSYKLSRLALKSSIRPASCGDTIGWYAQIIIVQPWESIAMDFIFELPKTPIGNDSLLTLIDRFNKQAHFIPMRKKIGAYHMVKLFM